MSDFDAKFIEEKILSEWDLQLRKKIKVLGNSFKINSDRGTKVLKKAKMSKERMRFVVNTMEALHREGFRQVSRFIYTKYGDPFVVWDDQVYYLTDYIDGNSLDFAKPESFKTAMSLLATLHNTGPKLGAQAATVERADLGDLFSERLESLQEWAKGLNKLEYRTNVDNIFLGKASTIYAKGLKALYYLKKNGYQEQLASDLEAGMLIHRDFVGKNVMVNKRGEHFIIGFDRCGPGSCVHDIARVLDRYMSKYNWDPKVLDTVLHEYAGQRELSKRERAIILGYLMYPNSVYRVAARYFRAEADVAVLPRWEEKMQEAIEEVEFKESQLLSWAEANGIKWESQI